MHNIAEGFDAGSDAEFIRFLKISRRSVSEVQSQLYLALDQKYITSIQLKEAYDKATEVNPVRKFSTFQRDGSHGALDPMSVRLEAEFAEKGIVSSSPLQAVGLSNGVKRLINGLIAYLRKNKK